MKNYIPAYDDKVELIWRRLYVNMNELFSPATGMLVSLFEFEISQFVIFWGLLEMRVIFMAFKNKQYFFGWLEFALFLGYCWEKKVQNYFLEIDFHSLFCLVFETKLIKFILKRHYSSKLKH